MAKTPRKHQQPTTPRENFELGRFAVTPQEVSAEQDERVRLVEHDGVAHPLLIYATPNGIRVDLPFFGGTLWATQQQMADMFGVKRNTVSEHLVNIFKEGELAEAATSREFREVRQEGGRRVARTVPQYNLNAIISVGYRVSSVQGTMFRVWSTDKLVQILSKGFYVDKERLINQGGPDALDEFRQIARDIRTSIRNSYREVLRLCTLCADYDGSSEMARTFFMSMENKLLWASAGKTAPQLVLERADAEQPDMGLTYYAGRRGPTQKDVVIGNNYLAPGEQERKGRATEMWLTYVEEQLDQGRLPTMAAVAEKLDSFIKFNQWQLLTGPGRHSRDEANAHALEQLDLYRERIRSEAEAGKFEKS